jgi:hypothetical protein
MTKEEKECFLRFTSVLLVYLAQKKDLDMLRQVKKIIRHCIVKYKRKQTGDESATEEMRDRLREVVNVEYWKRAELLLNRGLKIEV